MEICTPNIRKPYIKVTVYLKLIYVYMAICPHIQPGHAQMHNGYEVVHSVVQEPEQQYRVSGQVIDGETGHPMVGVNVFLPTGKEGTVTDKKGCFSMFLPSGEHTLVFSFLGYERLERTINITGNKELHVTMIPGSREIDAVTITSQRSFFGDMDKGRTIESIGAKEVGQLDLNNASDILHARLAGVWATRVSGAPGDHQKIRVRGINSLFGSVDPLYVIDGVPVPNVNFSSLGIAHLNTNDIENVTVLKEASSTALYGYQGGNGVVLIDTKSGGGDEISFSATFGIQRQTNFYDLMNTRDFLASLDSSRNILGSGLRGYYPVYTDSICYTDYQDLIFQDGTIHEYQLSANGKWGNTGYYLSGNYTDHKGILMSSAYRKYNLSAKVNRSFGQKFTVEALYRGAYQENRNNLDSYGGNATVFQGINKSPCFQCTPDSLYYVNYPDDRELANRIYIEYPELNQKQDIEGVLDNNSQELNITSHTIGGFAKYLITDNLAANLSSTLSFRNYQYATTNYLSYVTSLRGSTNFFFESGEQYLVSNQQINLNWHRSFGSHQLKFLAAYRNYTDNVNWEVDTTSISYLQAITTEGAFPRGSMAINGEHGAVTRRINSLIGHVNYNYNKKYFISAVANYDHLKEGETVDEKDVFPSVAFNWYISREFGLDGLRWLNDLNLYVNWGQVGNYPLNGLSNDLYQEIEYEVEDTVLQGYIIDQLANHQLQHEKINEYNVGSELSLLNSRINFNIDFYWKKNYDLIMLRDIPYYYGGGGRIFINVGEAKNQGVELNLELIPIQTSVFTWFTRFNYSANDQIIRRLADQEELRFVDDDKLVPEFVIRTNAELGSIMGYNNLGRWTEKDEQSEDPFIIEEDGMKYQKVDTSNNHRLNENDRVAIGNAVPDYTWNWQTSLRYKEFSLDFTWYAVIGVDKYNATRAATYIAGTNRGINDLIYDTVDAVTSDAYYQSSAFIEDASFIRLKQVRFTYAPEKKLYEKVRMQFSLNFQNLLTITRYKGYDPESTIYTDNNFSDNAVDRGAYPSPATITASVQLKF